MSHQRIASGKWVEQKVQPVSVSVTVAGALQGNS